ncbi:hypothetical protein [Sinosporangium siamense]|uniref:Uncharacterized protein n=1 Tax=Sinosporangium siamense TaxID=1367973 RepID=A0A919V9L1_9ACTN|nr:hypothetical protein [Sinosporangium siamense]GII97335.1 hypothetical protein Ssi02_75660 [Sinosporangium siamense]
MRFVIDLVYTVDGVHGQVLREGSHTPETFTGWLGLLRLLEPSSNLFEED